jgi:ATP-dependent exoDNAse (exonuclease V) beta subunit
MQPHVEGAQRKHPRATRARDHLVIPCLPDEPRKGWALPALQALLPPGDAAPFGARATAMREGGTKRGKAEVSFFDSQKLTFDAPTPEGADQASSIDGGEAEATTARTAEEAWKANRRAQRAAGRGAPAARAISAEDATPSEKADDTDTEGEGASASHPDENHAAAFGRLVHALLALPEPLGGEALVQAAQTQRLAFGLSETEAAEAADLAERAQALPAVAAAQTAEAVHRELPFTCRMNGQVVTGRIDLAYRTNGAWTVIDFKTDRPGGEALADYKRQVALYATGIHAAAGEPASPVLVVL